MNKFTEWLVNEHDELTRTRSGTKYCIRFLTKQMLIGYMIQYLYDVYACTGEWLLEFKDISKLYDGLKAKIKELE